MNNNLDNAIIFKPWGYEYLFSGSSKGEYAGWVLHMDGGFRTSVHCHNTMKTVLYVLSGKIGLDLYHGSTIINEGKKFFIYATEKHRLSAIYGDAIVIELEMPSDKLDSMRISDDWHREFEEYASGCKVVTLNNDG